MTCSVRVNPIGFAQLREFGLPFDVPDRPDPRDALDPPDLPDPA